MENQGLNSRMEEYQAIADMISVNLQNARGLKMVREVEAKMKRENNKLLFCQGFLLTKPKETENYHSGCSVKLTIDALHTAHAYDRLDK